VAVPTFHTTLLLNGNNVGIRVPDEIVESFGAGKRVPVTVTINGYTFSNTVAVMGGAYMVGVAKVHREAAGVAGGEEHDVVIEHDRSERTVDVPDDLAAALSEAGVREAFDALAFSHRKEHVRAVNEAKAAATRERRIARIVDGLRG
jgi:hypothetical protein